MEQPGNCVKLYNVIVYHLVSLQAIKDLCNILHISIATPMKTSSLIFLNVHVCGMSNLMI